MVRGRMWVAAACGLLIAGCAGNGEGTKDPSPVPTAPAAKTEGKSGEPTIADWPKLPDGAGEIDEDAPKEFTVTSSGLQYRILRKSEGKKPKATDSVVAHYKGWLDNGKQFDSSYDRGQPTPFPLDGVIAGWTEGLQLIGEGGMIELEIPGHLGYRERGEPRAGIGPNATLHFIVELVKVK